MTTDHIQVPFITADGRKTEVDEGLVELLEALKSHGVRTQFSCEGGEQHAYFVATHRTAISLLNKIRRLHRDGLLSKESTELVNHFLSGYRMFQIAFYPRRSGEYQSFSFVREWGNKKKDGYSVELSFQPIAWGRRITIRWPKDHTKAFVELLQEIQ